MQVKAGGGAKRPAVGDDPAAVQSSTYEQGCYPIQQRINRGSAGTEIPWEYGGMEQIYTTKTLAELLQVSPSTIRRETEEGRIACFKVGTQIRFREFEVQRYLSRRHLKRTKTETAEIVYLAFRQR